MCRSCCVVCSCLFALSNVKIYVMNQASRMWRCIIGCVVLLCLRIVVLLAVFLFVCLLQCKRWDESGISNVYVVISCVVVFLCLSIVFVVIWFMFSLRVAM